MDHPLLDGLNPDEKRLGAGAEEPQFDCGHGCGVDTWTRSPGVGRFGCGRKMASGVFQEISSGGILRMPLSGRFLAVSSLIWSLPPTTTLACHGERGVVSLGFSASGPKTRIQHGTAKIFASLG